MSALDRLLDLQEHDTAADQLRHRREHLAPRQELAGLDDTARSVAERRATVEAERHDLVREQTRLEDEVSLVEEKRTQTDRQLYSGSVTAPRELQALQDEVAALDRRRRTLEDELLEIMTAVEPLDAALADLASEAERLDADRDRVSGELAAAEAEIDAEIATLEAERSELAGGLPPEQLTAYDDARRRLGGVAVARLVGTSCGGCHLMLSAVEIDRIRKLPADQPAVCEECGRLLVH